MKLFTMPGSCALSCHVALEWAGADYEVEGLSREDLASDAFRAVNPKAKVPALRLGDGTVVTEALAVLVHIAQAHPDAAGLLPPAGVHRTAMLEALSELTGEFHPAFFPIHVPDRFTDEEGGREGVRRRAHARVRDQYDRWEERMADRDWVVAGHRSVADPYLYAMCRWSGIVEADIAEWPALARFVNRVEAEGGTLAAVEAEGLELLRPSVRSES